MLAGVAAVGTTLVLPGVGLVVAGPLAAALAGAGAGGITGGLIGALIGAGIPEERVKHYEEGIKNGGILMGVTPRSDEDVELHPAHLHRQRRLARDRHRRRRRWRRRHRRSASARLPVRSAPWQAQPSAASPAAWPARALAKS